MPAKALPLFNETTRRLVFTRAYSYNYLITVDFVIPSPGESLIKSFDKWNDWAGKSFCDYAFHVVVSWWSDQVKEEMGILARERGMII
jgi:dihydroorotase-like cyclic amidohydrolase